MTRQPRSLVAIDANILVWGVRKRDGTAEQLQRAKWLFDEFDRDQRQIVVPTVAISEYLVRTDAGQHRAILATLRERFIIAPFEVRAASLAASLFREALPEMEKHKPDGRKCVRADCMIVATAKTMGATVFYSHDNGCRNVAKRARMAAYDLPTHREDLFDS